MLLVEDNIELVTNPDSSGCFLILFFWKSTVLATDQVAEYSDDGYDYIRLNGWNPIKAALFCRLRLGRAD